MHPRMPGAHGVGGGGLPGAVTPGLVLSSAGLVASVASFVGWGLAKYAPRVALWAQRGGATVMLIGNVIALALSVSRK
jgi:hypothetical protein